MADKSAEIILVGKTVRRKLIVSHLLSSSIPFLVVLYLLFTYVSPRMLDGGLSTPVLMAIFALIGVLVSIGYYVAWDMGKVLSLLARNAEAREGFDLLVDRGDEIGAVMRSFSQTLDMLKRRTEEVNLFSVKLEAANQELALMNRRLRELSYTDELTGVRNRRYFNLALAEEIRRSERYRRYFSLTILDIDEFKRVNDEHGHTSGDKVLAEVGVVLRENTRVSDVVCRFGGEEFAVVLPETEAEKAKLFAEKMLRDIREREFTVDGGTIVRITASAGVSMYPTAGQDFEELINSADQALYQAKSKGGDRVYVRETLDQ